MVAFFVKSCGKMGDGRKMSEHLSHTWLPAGRVDETISTKDRKPVKWEWYYCKDCGHPGFSRDASRVVAWLPMHSVSV